MHIIYGFGVILFSALLWLCYDFTYKTDFKIAHIRQADYLKLSFAVVCY